MIVTTTDVIAALALAVASLSLGISWWGTFRDRVSLKVTARIYGGGPEYGPEYIKIRVVNVGRRVAVLTTLGGELADGRWQGTGLGASGTGLHLAESQFYESNFSADDIDAVCPDAESQYVSLWFEDSHGRRHKVPNSESLLLQLAATRPPNTKP
jgi:hypothetical protein